MRPDLGALKESGAITIAALEAAAAAARPGVSTKELDVIAEAIIRDAGGTPAFLGYSGFPAALCTSVNGEVVHGIPSERQLLEGDIVSLDLGTKISGWYTDSALTVGVGQISDEAQALMDVTLEALRIALPLAVPGNHTGDVGAAVQRRVEDAGLSVVRDCVGHGIGRHLHEEPAIPNFGKSGAGAPFKLDQAVAIEPMVVTGSGEVQTADDQWTIKTRDGGLAAHFEETILPTAEGQIRLTPLGVLQASTQGAKLGKVS